MKRFLYVATFVAACALVDCARVGVPPGRERVEDDEPPRLKKVETIDANHLDVYFSEAMDETTVRDAGNYSIRDEAGEPLPLEAAVVTRADAVTLVTASQEAGAKYTLVARNVADASGGNRIERGNSKDFKGSENRDEKAPAVAATFPVDGAQQVGLFSEILVEFTDVMAVRGDVADAIALYDDLGTEIAGEGGFERHRLRFRAARRLDYSTKYTVVVKDTCADLAGNPLYRESRFSFTTIEDTEEVKITGRVRVPGEGVSPAGVEVRLSLSPDPAAEGARVVGYAEADDEGNFVLAGTPPNSEAKASYHLVAAVDENGDGAYEFVGGYGFSEGKAAALPTLLAGGSLENVEVVLSRADVSGPDVEEAALSPNPTGGQRACYVCATFADPEGSAVVGAEVFFDEIWSDGTGVELFPVGAAWGAKSRATGERYVFDLERLRVKKRGEHVAYVHAKDAAGNWGEFSEVPFEVTAPPKPARKIEGMVWFEELPAEGALVTATPAGGEAPCALAVTAEAGLFTLEKLPPGAYAVAANLDEDGDGRWRTGEPEGVGERLVDVSAASARGVEIRLTYGPSLSSANARLHNFGATAGSDARAVLTVSAAARDRDFNLERVWASLPGGEEAELADGGAPPDEAAGDGIYTFSREYRGADLALLADGEVKIWAEDSQGNRAAATAAEYPGLGVRKLEAPALAVDAGPEGLDVSWEPVPGADGGYVVFLVPADRLDRFTGLGTGELYSNFQNPVYGNTLFVSYEALEDWWAYPAGSRFVVFLVASAGDGESYEASDKALSSVTWNKPAPR
jgi:hypothetical protein